MASVVVENMEEVAAPSPELSGGHEDAKENGSKDDLKEKVEAEEERKSTAEEEEEEEELELKEEEEEHEDEKEPPTKRYNIGDFYKDVESIDIGRCMLVKKLPTSLYEDEEIIFNDTLVSMLADDFGVSADSIESITRIAKEEDGGDAACQAMVSFKSRVHKHRVMAVRQRAGSAYSLDHVEKLPAEVVERVKVAKKEESIVPNTQKKNDKQGEKKEPFRDDHSSQPFVISWDGAPEFQWRIPDANSQNKLICENADVLDLFEPFMYRTTLRAQRLTTSMPGRVSLDDSATLHYGSIHMQFTNDMEGMHQAMLNLIYFRSKGNRRVKIYLPQTKNALKRKNVFEQRLGRKIEYTETMRQLVVKAEDLSLEESSFGVDEAKEAFPEKEIEKVERVVDALQNVCFLVTFKSAEDTVFAHASTRKMKIGEVSCRVYMHGVETSQAERPDKFMTRVERLKVKAEETAKRRKENAEKKGEAPEKKMKQIKQAKTATSKIFSPNFPKRRGGPSQTHTGESRGNIPMNKTNHPPFKHSTPSRGSSRGSARGARPFGANRGSFDRDQRSSRGGAVWATPPAMGSRRGMENRGTLGAPPFKSPKVDNRTLDEMVMEQRRQMEMQEQIIRQQEMISAMAERLRGRDDVGLSNSAFRSPTAGSSSSLFDRSASASYMSPSNVAYNKAGDYSSAPPFEPLSSYTPSHLSAPARSFDDSRRSTSDFGSAPTYDSYSSSKTSSYGNSSSYRDRRY